MTLVVSNQGERILLDAATGKTPATTWTLRLFVNDHVPVKGDTEASYTEASGGGYAGIALDASQWATTPGSPTVSVQPVQSFVLTGPLAGNGTIFGYFVTRQDGQFVYAERLGSPVTPLKAGDGADVTPRITLGSLVGD